MSTSLRLSYALTLAGLGALPPLASRDSVRSRRRRDMETAPRGLRPTTASRRR
jgi:hypothetical protein